MVQVLGLRADLPRSWVPDGPHRAVDGDRQPRPQPRCPQGEKHEAVRPTPQASTPQEPHVLTGARAAEWRRVGCHQPGHLSIPGLVCESGRLGGVGASVGAKPERGAWRRARRG